MGTIGVGGVGATTGGGGAGGCTRGSGQGVLVKSFVESVLPVTSSRGMTAGSVVA